MSKDLPKIFRNDIDKEIVNNKDMVYVKNGINNNINISKDNNETITEKINKLFNSNRHVFNIPVIITTKNNSYDTKIAGRMKNFIVTLDNDVIDIDDIINIEKKD